MVSSNQGCSDGSGRGRDRELKEEPVWKLALQDIGREPQWRCVPSKHGAGQKPGEDQRFEKIDDCYERLVCSGIIHTPKLPVLLHLYMLSCAVYLPSHSVCIPSPKDVNIKSKANSQPKGRQGLVWE